MKVFLFSTRFLIPLFIVWIGHLSYVGWKLWNLYKNDFKGKGLPSSLKFEWIWDMTSGELMLLNFFLVFVVAMTFYSHHNLRKEKKNFNPFSRINLLLLIAIALGGFFFTSFNAPRNSQKTRQFLMALIYSRSYNEFKLEIKKPIDEFKNEKMMTLPELLKKKASIGNQKDDDSFRIIFDGNNLSSIEKVKWEIATKYALPFSIILFYIIGVFMGLSFYKVNAIIPILISSFLIFGGWFYCQRLFEFWFRRGKINVFWGAYGPGILIFVLLLGWYLGLRKYGAFNKQTEEMLSDFTADE